jgi:hypothetical protein
VNFAHKLIFLLFLVCTGMLSLSENVRADISDVLESYAHDEGLAISRYIKIDSVPGLEALRSIREHIHNEGFTRCTNDPSGKKPTVACKRGPFELLVMVKKGSNRLQIMSRINLAHLDARSGKMLDGSTLETAKEELKNLDEQLFSFLKKRFGDAAY